MLEGLKALSDEPKAARAGGGAADWILCMETTNEVAMPSFDCPDQAAYQSTAK
jgi:hypothetical protein